MERRNVNSKTQNDFVFICANGSNLFKKYIYIFFFAVALRPNAGHGLLILEVF